MKGDPAAFREIVAKYPGKCFVCQEPLAVGETVHWRPKTKALKHTYCQEARDIPTPAKPDHGTFGQPF